MENFIASAQRIIKNKNFVTIIGIIVILTLLYFGYNGQINKAVQPVSVPTALDTIQPRTEITEDDIEMVDMPAISITANVITNKDQVVGKYSNVNSVIPAGSMFYVDTVIEKDDLPDSVFLKVKSGEIVYNFPVDMESTYGNSIFPGNKIDIYMKTGDGNDEKVMLGKLVENIEVLAVKDSSGRDVFENTSEERTPSMIIFGVPADIYLLLKKAYYLSSLDVVLFPVPHGGTVDTKGATEVSTQQLADYIEAHAVNIPTTTTTEDDELLPTIKVTNSNSTSKAKITYPKGCGSDYICTYSIDYDPITGISNDAGNVTKTSKTVTLKGAGTITATLTEKDGTEHVATVQHGTTDATSDTTGTTSGTTTTQ